MNFDDIPKFHHVLPTLSEELRFVRPFIKSNKYVEMNCELTEN